MTNINNSARSLPIQNLSQVQKAQKSTAAQASQESKQAPAKPQSPKDSSEHKSIGSADSSPNQVSFASPADKQPDKQAQIKELDGLMTENKEALSNAIKDAKGEMGVLGFIMEHAEQSLSEEGFSKLEKRLFPQPPVVPEDATPEQKAEMKKDYEGRLEQSKDMKDMLMKNVETFQKSSSPQALDNLVKYLAKNTVNVAKENPGC